MNTLLTRPSLDALVKAFDNNPVENQRLIRQVLDANSKGFCEAALPLLTVDAESHGAQFVTAILMSKDLLLSVLCDPALDREQVTRISRAAMRADSVADVKIAQKLVDSFEADIETLSLLHAVRLMDVLSEVSTGARLLPSMLRMLRHPNPYLRSKAALLVGRAKRSGWWASDRQNDADPRIRANAIEGLWGVGSSAARELLQSAASDNNNRVAGNAILGLYRLGETSAIADILAMARHESPVFRATAAWVMGQTGDPRFKDALAGLLREPGAVVRGRSFAALRAIRAGTPSGDGSAWSVAGRMAPDEPQMALRRIQVAVASDKLQPPAALLPTDFIVSEDGQPVIEYDVTDRPPADSLATIFVFPQTSEEEPSAWVAGAFTAAPWKRSADLWAAMHYASESSGPWDSAQAVEPFRLHSSTDGAIAEVTGKPSATVSAGIWQVLWRAMQGECGPFRGRRNIIIFNRAAVADSPAPELISAIASRGNLQVVSTVPDTLMEQLCQGTNGHFQRAASDEESANLIAHAYLHLLTRYEITYHPVVPEAAEIRVRVHHRTGAGETTIRRSNP